MLDWSGGKETGGSGYSIYPLPPVLAVHSAIFFYFKTIGKPDIFCIIRLYQMRDVTGGAGRCAAVIMWMNLL